MAVSRVGVREPSAGNPPLLEKKEKKNMHTIDCFADDRVIPIHSVFCYRYLGGLRLRKNRIEEPSVADHGTSYSFRVFLSFFFRAMRILVE